MSTIRPTLPLLGALIVAACNGGTGEPPNLPAPEYEPPRTYDPDTAIDGAADEEAIPDAPPPEPPVVEPPPPSAEGAGGAAEAEAAGGAAPES